VRALETGPTGNVGANTITVLIDSVPGVQTVTNPNPVGDPSHKLTNGKTPLIIGKNEETDSSLRGRVLETTAIGGAGSVDAVKTGIENIDEVVSADIFTNRTGSTVDGVDGWHTEVRVYGGDIDDIAAVIYETMTLGTIKTLQGGANGSLEQTTIDGGDLYGTFTIPITRPSELTLDITIDFVHDSSYGGDKEVKNAIVDYIGGTRTNGVNVVGLGQGKNVIIAKVENIVEDVPGVVAVKDSKDTVIDTDNDGNDDTINNSNGVDVLSVGDSEVATVADATTDITLNKTAQ